MMTLRKFTRSEKTEVIDPKLVKRALGGKRSTKEMTEEERKKFAKRLDK